MCKKYTGIIAVLVLQLIVVLNLANIKQVGPFCDELLTFNGANSQIGSCCFNIGVPIEGNLVRFDKEKLLPDRFTSIYIYGKDIAENGLSDSKLITDYREIKSKKKEYISDNRWVIQEEIKTLLYPHNYSKFNPLNVLFNEYQEVHPISYFIILNIVNSLFPNQLVNGALGINIFFYLLTSLLLYYIIYEITNKYYLALAAMIVWGLCVEALSMTMFVRMYMMSIFMTLLYVCATYKVYTGTQIGKRENVLFIASIILAFNTQYYFSIFAVLFTILLFCFNNKSGKKNWLKLSIAGGILAVCVYPFSIISILGSGFGISSLRTTGVHSIPAYFERLGGFFYFFYDGLIGPLGLILFIIFIFVLLVKRDKVVEYYFDNVNNVKFVVALLISCILYVCIITRVAPFYTDRYVACLFPIVIIVLVNILDIIFVKFSNNKKMIIAINFLVIFSVLINVQIFPNRYLYSDYKERAVKINGYENLDCAYFGTSPTWRAVNVLFELERYPRVFFLDLEHNTLEKFKTENQNKNMIVYIQKELLQRQDDIFAEIKAVSINELHDEKNGDAAVFLVELR